MTMQKLLLGVVGPITGRYLWVKTRGVPCTDSVYRTCVPKGGRRSDEQIPQVIVIMQFRQRVSTRVLSAMLLLPYTQNIQPQSLGEPSPLCI
jgi:hypothetical protein